LFVYTYLNEICLVAIEKVSCHLAKYLEAAFDLQKQINNV